jgi:membrane protein required for colicin V production
MREVLSLAGWVAGIWLAVLYAAPLAAQIPLELPWPVARVALAAVAIVIGCLILAALVATLIRRLLSAVSLSGTDRLLGALFGAARAALLILVVVFLGGRTALVEQPSWKQSVLLPHIEAAVRFVTPLVAPALAVARAS